MLSCSTDIETLLKALKFASEKHQKQRRKSGEDEPYINHPIAVAEILCRVGKIESTDLLVAAVLHDTIEDTNTQAKEIEEQFGSKVLELVRECTDDKSLPKVERKQLQIEHACHMSEGAKLIKIADKTHNIQCIYTHPPKDWSWERRKEYLDWSEKVVDGLKGVNSELDALYFETLANARAALEAERSGNTV